MDASVAPDDFPSNLPIPAPPPGSLPLRAGKQELYCWRVAGLVPKPRAYCEAFGYEITDPKQYHAARGNASRLERRKDIQARIAWLSRQQEEILAQKRERLEAWQWQILEHNPADFYEIAERPLLDAKGKPILKDGEFIMVKYQRAKFLQDLSAEALAAVEGLQITDSGKVMVKTYSKMQAHDALRKMLGIGAQNGLVADEVGEMSTTEIVAELQTLGVDVKLSVSVTR